MNEEHIEQIAEEIFKTGKADIEYIEEQENLSEEYKKGWKHGIDQIVTELLGRQEENSTQKLKESIK